MSQFSINIKPLEKAQSESQGSIFQSNIFLRYDDFLFPSKDWIDNPVIILNWWINNSLDNASPVQCFFMEGPYFFTIEKNEKNAIIKFHEETLLGEMQKGKEIIISHQKYLDILHSSALELMTIIPKNHLRSKDFKELEFSISRLEKSIARKF